MSDSSDVILKTLLEMKGTLGSMDEKLDAAAIKVNEHEVKITKLENQSSRIKWIAVGAGAVITFGWKVVEALITHH